MVKVTIHTDTDTAQQLKDELPDGAPWGEYLLECVRLRKRVESREVYLSPADTRSVEEKGR